MDHVPMYLHKKYLHDPKFYVYPPFSSMKDCMFKTLTTRNVDTLNAWTMFGLFVFVGAFLMRDLRRKAQWPLLMLSLAVMLHAPISLRYHALRAFSPDVAHRGQRSDIIFIYIHQFLVHIALTVAARIPMCIAVMTWTLFAVITYSVKFTLSNLPAERDATKVSVHRMWIMNAHLIPILLRHGMTTQTIFLFATAIVTYGVHILKIPQRFTKSLKYGYSHEYMHVGLWVIYYMLRKYAERI